MKPILVIILLFCICSLAKAQQKSVELPLDSNRVYKVLTREPEFPGGAKKLDRFLAKTIRYPASALKNHIQGEVLLSFIVEKDGSLSDIRVVNSVSKDIDAEAVRVMNLSPKWIPGMQNGVVVRVLYNQPVSFILQDY